MRFRFSVFLIFLFFLGILTLSDENVSASTLSDQKDIRSTSTEFQSENMANLSIQLNQDAVVLNSNMDGIGTIYKNQIIPVTKINDELYEIQGRFDIGTQYDEKLYLKDPVFTEAPSVTGRNDVLKENLIDDSITFNEGVTLSSFFQSTTPVLSIDSCITFSSYYKVQNQIVIQWNNSFYYVNPINHELVEDTQDSTKQEKEITSETEEDNSLSLYSPQESLNTVPSVRSTGTQNGVKKLMDIQNFNASDNYFEVTEVFVTVYDNSDGTLRPVGYLNKGQVYPRIGDFGDWHQIKFGKKYGYVWKAATKVANAYQIKNENKGVNNSGRSFTANKNLTVYDNTGGSLVPFGTIFKGEKYPIIANLGDWIQIDFSGRIGYIYGPAVTVDFSTNDKYFKVLEDIVTIYDNSSGSLVPVGYLTKGQVYPRVSDFGDWHKIQLSNKYGYIWKDATAVVSNPYIANENRSSVKFGNILFKALQNLSVYDTSSGSLISFGEINMNQTYRAISEYGSDWLKIDFSGRIGYVYKPATEVTYISKTIFLDPGHGGHDSGAADGGYLEKNINLSVAKKVKSILTGRGYTVIMSREDDTYLDLYERAGKANQLNADIFVSIHTNSAGKSSSPVNGIESYYYEYDPEYPSKINVDMHNNPERVSRSITLTKIIQEKLISYTGATNRGVDGASFAVIRESKMPATLIELGFITNNNERQKLVSNSYQDTLARAIADGIVEYLKHY
ncbi:N-acetylmuramoyl-L-alanine amidase [Caldifermentibacillus hisashii]|uniref:N-acetylmuramoyl-L-alanine amidase n=1 Tax=Caldifermentibacillus hisashii TaxID=996558 RepID=UPI0030E983BB